MDMNHFQNYIISHRSVEGSIITLVILLFITVILMLFFYFSKYRRVARNAEIAGRNPTIISSQFAQEYWEWFTFPVFRVLMLSNITPNQVTIISLIFGLISGILFAFGHISSAGWFLIISGTFDTLDGRIARHQKINSKAGAFFDSIADRYTDYFIFAGIVTYFSIFDPSVGEKQSNAYLSLLGMVALLGTHLISYSKERGASLGALDEWGIMQRADRIMILGSTAILDPLIYAILNYFFDSRLVNRYYGLGVGLFLIGFFSNLTAIRRIKRVLKNLRKQEQLN